MTCELKVTSLHFKDVHQSYILFPPFLFCLHPPELCPTAYAYDDYAIMVCAQRCPLFTHFCLLHSDRYVASDNRNPLLCSFSVTYITTRWNEGSCYLFGCNRSWWQLRLLGCRCMKFLQRCDELTSARNQWIFPSAFLILHWRCRWYREWEAVRRCCSVESSVLLQAYFATIGRVTW